MKIRLLSPIAFVAMTAVAQRAKMPKSPLTTTFCEVAKNPSAYIGKRVTFRAEYMTDHIERSLLISKDCQGQGILPYTKEHVSGLEAFNDATYVRSPQNLDSQIVATFTGTFHFSQKPEMCMSMNKEICRRSLEIDKVDDLVLTMTPKRK